MAQFKYGTPEFGGHRGFVMAVYFVEFRDAEVYINDYELSYYYGLASFVRRQLAQSTGRTGVWTHTHCAYI